MAEKKIPMSSWRADAKVAEAILAVRAQYKRLNDNRDDGYSALMNEAVRSFLFSGLPVGRRAALTMEERLWLETLDGVSEDARASILHVATLLPRAPGTPPDTDSGRTEGTGRKSRARRGPRGLALVPEKG